MNDSAVGYLRLSQDGKSLNRQRNDIESYADERGFNLVHIYDEGKRASGFDENRPEYQSLLDHVDSGDVHAVIVPNLSRLSRDRKERLRLLLDLDAASVRLHSYELGRPIELDNDWELVQQSIQATADDVEKRKEIERAKRSTRKRLDQGYDHGRPPYGLQYDCAGEYWIPDGNFGTALECIRMRDEGTSWREIEQATGVNKDTARRIYDRRSRYLEQSHEDEDK